MPKHSKQRGRVNRVYGQRKDPIVDERVRQDKVLPVIDQLKSPEFKERSLALKSILSLAEDGNVRHMLLRERLIKIVLASVLGDPSLELVSLGIGILATIVRLEGHDPAVYLVREKIQNRIGEISSSAITSAEELPSSDVSKISIISEVSERIFRLVSAIVMYVGEVPGLESPVKLALLLINNRVNKHSVSSTCIDAAFEMLYYVSEGSEQTFEDIVDDDKITELKAAAVEADRSWSTKVYGLGLEFNLVVLNTDDPSLVNSYADQLTNYLLHVPKSELNGVQVALELLAILAQSDDSNLISFLVEHVTSVILNGLLQTPACQLDCIAVLNNLGWAQNALELPWGELAGQIYEATMTSCFQQLEDLELVSSALGLIGATLIQNVAFVDSLNFKELAAQVMAQIESLYNRNDAAWVPVARALVVILTSRGLPALRLEMIADTGRLIFLLLEHSVVVEAHIDALNSLFDLFGDNNAPYDDKEYKEPKLNDRLKQLRPSLKRSLKSPPKSDSVLRGQASDALTNLENFIAYKQS